MKDASSLEKPQEGTVVTEQSPIESFRENKREPAEIYNIKIVTTFSSSKFLYSSIHFI